MINSKLYTETYRNAFLNYLKDEINILINNNWLTYTIAKEEQIRIWLYMFFKNDYKVIEVESDLFVDSKVIAEYDLRIVEKEDFLIEIKRCWALGWWQNKYSEFLNSWKKDIDKLSILEEKTDFNPIINKKHKKSFILITFSDKLEKIQKYKTQELEEYINEKWEQCFVYKSLNIELSNGLYLNVFVYNSIK